ncbi:hypothetical protein AAFF_G00383060 [Aldrovandia affinis]|uniref:Reverse transcriptase n=1 Tax=Aldrovandia affinis TaxID=143900 RepID=A0AAD7T8B4_9TELE|nr:hypothetical protein AAFF_G00383060 [Aldrovandia affinis]
MRTTITQHHIEPGAAAPIRQRARRPPLAKWEEAEAKIREMAAAGIIQSSDSPWGSPAVLIDDALNSVSGSTWFNSLDLRSGRADLLADDILVHTSTYAVVLTNLRTVFQLIAKANLCLNPGKCSLFRLSESGGGGKMAVTNINR